MPDPDTTDTAKHPFVPVSGESGICADCGEHENWHKELAMADPLAEIKAKWQILEDQLCGTFDFDVDDVGWLIARVEALERDNARLLVDLNCLKRSAAALEHAGRHDAYDRIMDMIRKRKENDDA